MKNNLKIMAEFIANKFNFLATAVALKWQAMVVTLTILFGNARIALAAPSATDPFQKVSQDAEKLTGKIQGVTLIIVAVVLVGTGLIYALGSQDIKKGMRKYWGGIVIGVVVVFLGGNALAWGLDYFGMR